MAQGASPASAEAYAVARRLHEATEASQKVFLTIAARQGLSSPQARLIMRLFEPTAMKVVAEHLVCDASNVTGIASRLIERGFVTTTRGVDRRVKLLELTDSGRQIRASLEGQIAESSPALTRLTDAERRVLVGLLDKLMSTN